MHHQNAQDIFQQYVTAFFQRHKLQENSSLSTQLEFTRVCVSHVTNH